MTLRADALIRRLRSRILCPYTNEDVVVVHVYLPDVKQQVARGEIVRDSMPYGWTIPKDDTIYWSNVEVKSKWRNKGIGYYLADRMLEHSRKSGKSTLILQADPPALEFWRSWLATRDLSYIKKPHRTFLVRLHGVKT